MCAYVHMCTCAYVHVHVHAHLLLEKGDALGEVRLVLLGEPRLRGRRRRRRGVNGCEAGGNGERRGRAGLLAQRLLV